MIIMRKNKLSLEKINKSYGSHNVIVNFNCVFDQGCHALIGGNGSGKSTLLRLMSGSEKADSGDITFNEVKLKKNDITYKRYLGYAPDKLMIYPFLTGREFLNFVFLAKKESNKNVIDDMLVGFGINNYLSYRLEEMSLGNQKKFALVAAFIGDPALLLFDEPTNEIDASAKSYLIQCVEQKRHQNKIIIFSSHDVDFLTKTNAKQYHMEKIH